MASYKKNKDDKIKKELEKKIKNIKRVSLIIQIIEKIRG